MNSWGRNGNNGKIYKNTMNARAKCREKNGLYPLFNKP